MLSQLEYVRRLPRVLSPVGACFFLELPKVSHEDYMLAEHGRKRKENATQFSNREGSL